MMMSTLLDRIADWNPQLFRELKGRLKPRSLLLSFGVSFIIQFLVSFLSWRDKFDLAYKNSQIDDLQYLYRNEPKQAIDECLQKAYCLVDSGGNFALNWNILWQDFGQQVFLSLSVLFVPIVLVGGVYMLVSDLSQEEQRGTLNFIRLSPQKSESILIGKILGVPVLLYLGILLSFPLYLWAAHLAGIFIGFILCFFSLLSIISCLFYSLSILYVLIGGIHAWIAAFLVSGFALYSFPLVNFLFELGRESESALRELEFAGIYHFQWFNFPIGKTLFGVYSFVFISLGLVFLGIWQTINRKFRNPNATIISKQQSYVAMVCFQGWFLGLMTNVTTNRSEDQVIFGLIFLFMIIPCLFFALIAALSPHRQMLQDWARYSHTLQLKSGSSPSNNPSPTGHYSLWKDLIWGKKSPAVVAIFLNLLMTAIIWIPWLLTGPQQANIYSSSQFYKLNTILGFLLLANFILICSLVAQLMLMMKTSKRSIWAAGMIGTFVGLPFVIFSVYSISPETNPIPWLFSMFPIMSVFYASKMSICMAILVQWTVQGLLGWQLIRQLQCAGESTSKALLGGRT